MLQLTHQAEARRAAMGDKYLLDLGGPYMKCNTCQNFLGTDYYEDIGIIVLCKQIGQVKPSREATCEYEQRVRAY